MGAILARPLATAARDDDEDEALYETVHVNDTNATAADNTADDDDDIMKVAIAAVAHEYDTIASSSPVITTTSVAVAAKNDDEDKALYQLIKCSNTIAVDNMDDDTIWMKATIAAAKTLDDAPAESSTTNDGATGVAAPPAVKTLDDAPAESSTTNDGATGVAAPPAAKTLDDADASNASDDADHTEHHTDDSFSDFDTDDDDGTESIIADADDDDDIEHTVLVCTSRDIWSHTSERMLKAVTMLTLDCEHRHLTREQWQQLHMCHNLRRLKLADVMIDVDQLCAVFETLGSHLTHVVVHETSQDGEQHYRWMSSMLQHCTQLHMFGYHHTYDQEHAVDMKWPIRRIATTDVKELELGGTSQSRWHIPDTLATRLTHLYLSRAEMLTCLCDSLCQMRDLVELYIPWSYRNCDDDFANVIRSMPNLRVLDMTYMYYKHHIRFDDCPDYYWEGLPSIPLTAQAISEHNNLQVLLTQEPPTHEQGVMMRRCPSLHTIVSDCIRGLTCRCILADHFCCELLPPAFTNGRKDRANGWPRYRHTSHVCMHATRFRCICRCEYAGMLRSTRERKQWHARGLRDMAHRHSCTAVDDMRECV